MESQQLSDHRKDGLPTVVARGRASALSRLTAREFYMPHGGTCPWCDNELVVYTADALTGKDSL
jgi:hypothetical protein